MPATFIDNIYQAAIVPSEWPEVLDQLARIADAEGTLLFTAGEAPLRWLCSKRIEPLMSEFFTSPWALRNTRGERLVPRTDARFLTDLDALTVEEIERDPYYTDFLYPRGIGWVVGTTIRAPASDPVIFSIERAKDRGPVESSIVRELDTIRPHLARAAVLSAKIGLLNAKTTVDTLATLGLPAAVLRAGGSVLLANDAIRSLAPHVTCRAGDWPAFRDTRAPRLLRRLLSLDSSGGVIHPGGSFAVAGTDEAPPLVAHLLPIKGAGRDVFSDAYWILFFTPVRARAGLAPEVLQALYDLSPSESRILSLLLDGRTVEEAAGIAGITINTARVYLKAVFAKTNVRRQSELMRLLGATFEPAR